MPKYTLDCSLARETKALLDAFTLGYVEAAMWTLQGDDGKSLDYLGLHDIADSTIKAAIRDCAAFQKAYAGWLEQTEASAGLSGTDFWLTRNGHGAGFWDRGYTRAVSDGLTEGAHAEGSADWYVGDDGLVYQTGDE